MFVNKSDVKWKFVTSYNSLEIPVVTLQLKEKTSRPGFVPKIFGLSC